MPDTTRLAGGHHPLDPESPDLLAARLTSEDTPFRAWAAVALTTAAAARYRAEGKRMAVELADWTPETGDLQHADLAAYSILERTGFLTEEQRGRLREALPLPFREPERRARLYRSSTYLYLLARGVGPTLGCAVDLVRVIDDEIEAATERPSPDLTELSLLVAARFELAEISPVGEEAIRRTTGRIAGAERSWEAAAALRWLLEMYNNRWPSGEVGDRLREVARSFVESAATMVPAPGDVRPAVAAMLLEVATRRNPEFKLVSRADEEAALVARLRNRRGFEAAAYLFVITVVVGGPMYAAVQASWFGALVGVAGALGLAVPLAVYALLVVLGRPRDTVSLGVGVTTGFLYWAVALYAGHAGEAGWLQVLGGEGALLALFPALATSFWAGVNAFRNRHG